MRRSDVLLILIPLLMGACASPPPPYDYAKYVEADPQSILVVPVMNNSPEVGAGSLFLATITKPVVERGYYVFPVNLSRELLADAGLSDPGLVRDADATRLAALFGADAVLYVVITNWEAKYMLLTTTVTVGFEYMLKSGTTGETIWKTKQVLVYRPQGQSSGNAIADLVVMAAQAAITKLKPNYMPLARQANVSVATGANPQNPGFVIHNPLLPGPLDPAAYTKDRAARTAQVTRPTAPSGSVQAER